jgi:hypothetical protein
MARVYDQLLTASDLPPEVVTESELRSQLPLVLPEEIPDYETLIDNWVAKKSVAFTAAVQAVAPTSTGGTGGTGGGGTPPSSTTSQTPISIINSTTRRAAVPNAFSSNLARPSSNSISFQSVNGSTGDAQFPVSWEPGKVVDVVWEAPGFGTGLQYGSGAIQLSPQMGLQNENQAATNGVTMGQNDANGRLIFRAGGANNYYITNSIPNTANLRICFYGQANTAGILPYYSTDGGATWKSDFIKDGVTALQPIVIQGTLYLSFFSQASQTLSQNITVGVDATIVAS